MKAWKKSGQVSVGWEVLEYWPPFAATLFILASTTQKFGALHGGRQRLKGQIPVHKNHLNYPSHG